MAYDGGGVTGVAWCGVPPEDLPRIWPAIYDLILAACKTSNGRLTPKGIYEALQQRKMQLWLAEGPGVFVTQIIHYDSVSYARINIGTGKNRKAWQAHVSMLEAWAKEQGCNGIEAIARQGWARVLRPFGWQHTHNFIEKSF